jgi:tetratricopeptide (TPR) repeat protein
VSQEASRQEAHGSAIAQALGDHAHASVDIQNAFLQLDKEGSSQFLATLSLLPAPGVKELFDLVHNPEDVPAAIFRSEFGPGVAPYDIPHAGQREGGINVQERLYGALRRSGAVLVQSRAGLGKTREVVQLAARLCAEGWMVCVAKAQGDGRMAGPANFPDALRGRQLLFVVDDLHQRVDAGMTERKPYADRLDSFVEFFRRRLLPSEVWLLATVRTEPHHYDSLGFDPSHPFWRRFEAYELPEFSIGQLQQLLLMIAEREGVAIEKESVARMIANSDRTPRTLEQNLRLARLQGLPVTADLWLKNQLSGWSQLFQRARQRQPAVDAVYQSLHLLRIAGLPTRFTYVVRLATNLAHVEATTGTKELINARLLGFRQGVLDAFGDEQLRDSLESTGIPVPSLEDNWGRIIETIEAVLEDEPALSQDFPYLLQGLISNQRRQDAENTASRRLGKGADDADVYYWRGFARGLQENYAGAEEDYTAAIDRGKDDADVYYRRGLARASQENYAGAEEDLTAAIGRGLDDADVYYRRGRARAAQDNPAGMEKDLTVAMRRGLDTADVYYGRGLARTAQENHAGAEEDFTAAISRGLDDADVYYCRGIARAKQKNFAGAEEDLNAAISRGLDDADADFLGGMIPK